MLRKEVALNDGSALRPLVVDHNIITSTGPATAIDVAFKLLELLTDVENVNEVKRNMRFV